MYFRQELHLPDGRRLPVEKMNEYYTNHLIFKAMQKTIKERKEIRSKRCGDMNVWGSVVNEVNLLNTTQYPHSLPSNGDVLRRKYKQWQSEGYQSIIHRNFCNKHAQKVTDQLELLFLTIYCMSNNPYGFWVHEMYSDFSEGKLDLVNYVTGELFKPSDFVDKSGNPIEVSEKTVLNYLKKPSNKMICDNIRMSYYHYNGEHRPHVHRHAPQYSLSQVSLDDRDLPRKEHSGKRVKAYYAYDVTSGCLIGASYSMKKNGELFINRLRDMFRWLERRGFGLLLEMEVENHLVRRYEEDLMMAGVVFPFIRWCAPTNSQEKHAEQFIGQKKKGYEKRYQDGIGRFYAKDKSYKTYGERVYNEATNQYEIKEKTYSFERLVADDRETIIAYNNELHRDQKKYHGKTRMQVFLENINPEIVSINKAILFKYIGNCTQTSIRRNQYCQVQCSHYMLPTPEVIKLLKPNNYNVKAYWLDNEDGSIGEVYLYQDKEYLCKASLIQTFNTSAAEWTDVDGEAFEKQMEYISKYDKMVKDGRKKIVPVKVANHASLATFEDAPSEPLAPVFARRDSNLEELIEKYKGNSYAERAYDNI